MEDSENLYCQKNKLGHPTIEDIAMYHQQILNDIISLPTEKNIGLLKTITSPLRTPNDLYKEYLLSQMKTHNENTKE
ncbi:MAG: hypothetical protein QCI00_07180 [Candidatus Thermoplasmatota archaeon]|nr:hypothetical protein [Candidatus Thermoplasmatota archaeon]